MPITSGNHMSARVMKIDVQQTMGGSHTFLNLESHLKYFQFPLKSRFYSF